MIHAVIPAAGRSGRMGQPKQLMNVGGEPMLLAVAQPIIQCPHVGRTFIVTNSLVVSNLDLSAIDAHVELNDEPDAEMIDSIRKGVESLQRDPGLEIDDGLLICPGDQPGLTIEDIAQCCAAFDAKPSRLVIASHRGKHGHPLILPATRVPQLMSSVCDEGLRELIRAHASDLVTVELDNAAVLRNVNTPEDYERVCEE